MRRIVILLMLPALAVAFSGGDIRLRLLSPLSDPYDDDDWEEPIERGGQFGLSLGYDFELLPGLGAGPRFNGLLYNDTLEDLEGTITYDHNLYWYELNIGAGLRYRFQTDGALVPWVGLEVGFGWSLLTYSLDWTVGDLEQHTEESGEGSGLALELNAGAEWWFRPELGLTFSLDYHYLGVDNITWDDEDLPDWDLDELPQSLGLGLGVCYTL